MAQARGTGSSTGGGKGTTTRTVRKPNILKIAIIVIICLFIGFFGKITNFFGKFTGEVSPDGRKVLVEAPAEYKLDSRSVELNNGDEVWIPDVESIPFTSEDNVQDIPLGSDLRNEDYYMAVTISMGEHVFVDTHLLSPGMAVGEWDLAAIFKPGDDYTADVVYTFYNRPKTRIEEVQKIKTTVKFDVTGSSYFYDNKIGKEEYEDMKEKGEDAFEKLEEKNSQEQADE